MDFIIINGEIIKKQETGFKSFFWDEPIIITQKIWFGFGGIPLFHENIKGLKTILKTLNSEIPDLLDDESELFRITKRMLNKNRFFRSGIITLQIFIAKSEFNIAISSTAFPEFNFPISNQGLLVNFSELEKYSVNPLNQFDFYNAPFWKFAKARNLGTTFSNSIYINEKNAVCNCISSNIFLLKGNVLYTPSIETGCYIDSLRFIVLETARKLNLKVEESDCIDKADVFQMDEVFLAGEEHGIQLVLGVENKRFVQYYSRNIHEKLNEYLKGKIS